MLQEAQKSKLPVGAQVPHRVRRAARELARTKGYVPSQEVAAACGVAKSTPHVWSLRHEDFPPVITFRGLRFFHLDAVVAWYKGFSDAQGMSDDFEVVFGADPAAPAQ